ncbi:hypothetical protein PHMEG_00017513 [Phytophthora megakarya]|uniref:Uncharacterized protein n=1 Tax=Phytophthora megakarya TaxID=4795 RepID=A0A225VXW3_9STRA|nr:hypothetical protein PHMEG_00017513 [Phytophthora megakarya]
MGVEVLCVPGHHTHEASDFALLLVQEWLVACKFESTARCLADECVRTDRGIPSRKVWNRMVENLGFGPRSPATGGKRSGGDRTLLEALVRKSVEQHENEISQVMRNQVLNPQQVVTMSKKRELRFVHKRSLPRSRSATPSNNAPDRSPELSSSSSLYGLRPKSAMVCKSTPNLGLTTSRGKSPKGIATGVGSKRKILRNKRPISAASVFTPHKKSAMVCKSTPDLVVRTSRGKSPKGIATGVDSKRKIPRNKRPISAASVFTPHRDSLVSRKSIASIGLHSPTSGNNTLHSMVEVVDATAAKTIDRHTSSMVGLGASLPHIVGVVGPETAGANQGDRADAEGDTNQDNDNEVPVPALSLEEMSEERLMKQFGSISRCAIKKLRRVLAKSNAYSQEFDRSQRTLDKIKARAKLHQLRRVLAEEQTPLLTSTMASLTSEPCSLCLYVFPKISLTTKVSYKNIVDLRASWATAATGNETTSNDAQQTSEGLSQTSEGLSQVRITHLYDEAPVCVFCSQLVLNFSSYRPSSAERRAQHANERREALQHVKDLEAKEQHDREKCDPLDYYSYELNSDDDDSDVEEIVQIEQNGRLQVVRQRRRLTIRPPVQLGVVSRRLHYDTLRSDSLHMLTLDEWHKITR